MSVDNFCERLLGAHHAIRAACLNPYATLMHRLNITDHPVHSMTIALPRVPDSKACTRCSGVEVGSSALTFDIDTPNVRGAGEVSAGKPPFQVVPSSWRATAILLDDTDREAERETAQRWCDEFGLSVESMGRSTAFRVL